MISMRSTSNTGGAARWTLASRRGTYGGERLVFYMTLKQDGEKVTGTYSNPSGGGRATTDRPVEGTFKDGQFVMGATGSFKRTVTGDTMTGTFPARDGPIRNFTATRVKR